MDVGEGATNVHVITLTMDGLHHHGLGRNAVFDLNLGPFWGNFTGRGVNNDEALTLLTVNSGKGSANRQTVIRQSLDSLYLTINSQLEVAAQLAGLWVKGSNIRLRNMLASGRLKVHEVAANEHARGTVAVIDLGDCLNKGVHLSSLTRIGLSAGTPAPSSRTATGQGATSTCLGTGIRDSAQVQIVLGQLRAQEHLSVTERGFALTILAINVRVLRVGY